LNKKKGIISSFLRLLWKICKGIGRFVGEQWRGYQARKAREHREKKHFRRIAEEGKAFGYGVAYGTERGRDSARRAIYRERKAEEDWKRDPFGFKKLDKIVFGEKTKKRKKRQKRRR